jgi:hypothetical protein
MSQQVKSIRKAAKAYFIILAIALFFILLAGITMNPKIGPVLAVIGFGAGLVANVFAIFVIPIKALTLKEKR